MATLIILTNSKSANIKSNINNINTNNNTIDSILDSVFCTKCDKCIEKFMKSIETNGLFKFYWQPKVFRRDFSVFTHESSKYRLTLSNKIHYRLIPYCSGRLISRTNINCVLNIYNKSDPEKSKDIVLYDLYFNSNEKTSIALRIESVKKYILQTFGIDLNCCNDVKD